MTAIVYACPDEVFAAEPDEGDPVELAVVLPPEEHPASATAATAKVRAPRIVPDQTTLLPLLVSTECSLPGARLDHWKPRERGPAGSHERRHDPAHRVRHTRGQTIESDGMTGSRLYARAKIKRLSLRSERCPTAGMTASR